LGGAMSSLVLMGRKKRTGSFFLGVNEKAEREKREAVISFEGERQRVLRNSERMKRSPGGRGSALPIFRGIHKKGEEGKDVSSR